MRMRIRSAADFCWTGLSGMGLCVLLAGTGCGGSGSSPKATYALTVDSTSPTSGVAITVSPNDANGLSGGNTPMTLTYAAGTVVTVSAPVASGKNAFGAWSGCASSNLGTGVSNCTVTVNAPATVTANYTAPVVTSVVVTPATAAAIVGTTAQFTATVAGTGDFDNTVTWSLAGPAGYTGDVGTITNATATSAANGLYTTPYPAPASVTVIATSNQTDTVTGAATVVLNPPSAGIGPALSVDAGNQTHPISPLIYGMNSYQLVGSAAAASGVTLDRFGGDATSRYNYLLDVTNSAADYFFENQVGSTGKQDTSAFNQQALSDRALGAKTLGTVDVLGWVAKDGTSCSFPIATYPGQQKVDTDRGCGNGVYPQGTAGCANADGCDIQGNDPTVTSIAVGPAFAGQWVSYLVGKFGAAAQGGVYGYELDNEPTWWDTVHVDVHPVASTYDEVTNNGIATARAIKTADPTAMVNGPVVDFWWNYFYSKKDMEAGWSTGPCYEPWGNPVDRNAHGGVPFLEYYLQQFAKAETTYGARLLDTLDLHTYFAANYPAGSDNSVGLTTAGDTGEQQARLDSTRALWDSTYTDSSNNFPQPNYSTNPAAQSCADPQEAPQAIRRMRQWVAADYPGTKTAISEYNWGGQEHINGAIAQADILGIFGREGLDMATLWGPPDPVNQVPGLKAFEIYRNYDGAGSQFGDVALQSASANQSALSVYGALRSSDGELTVLVLNKTYGHLTSTLSLANLTPNGKAKAYLYSNANLAAIVAQPDVTVTGPTGSGASSTVTMTFPAQSITLLVIP